MILPFLRSMRQRCGACEAVVSNETTEGESRSAEQARSCDLQKFVFLFRTERAGAARVILRRSLDLGKNFPDFFFASFRGKNQKNITFF